jgi:chitodextrinase
MNTETAPARRRPRRALPCLSAALLAALALAAGPARGQTGTANSLVARWTAVGDDGDAGPVAAYELFYDTRAPGSDVGTWWNSVPFSQRLTLLPPLAPGGQPDSARVTGLTPSTTYYFVMVARDDAANVSGFSNVASGTTESCGAPTTAPSSFAADADSAGVLVTWDAPSDPAALSLRLYRATGSSPSWILLQSLPTDQTSYRDTGVAPATTYRYRAAWGGPVLAGITCEGPATAQAVVTTPGAASVAAGSGRVHVYPNPASDRVQVALDVAAPAPLAVHIRLFDMTGRWLATLAEGTFPPGHSVVTWDRLGRAGTRLAPGYYEILGTVGTSRVRERLVLGP